MTIRVVIGSVYDNDETGKWNGTRRDTANTNTINTGVYTIQMLNI